MNDQEGNSERPGFDLGTGMMTRDIFVPDGTMKSTSRENKKHPEASTEILVLVREMVMNRRCAAVGRGREGGYGMWYSCRGKIKHREALASGNFGHFREKSASESPTFEANR